MILVLLLLLTGLNGDSLFCQRVPVPLVDAMQVDADMDFLYILDAGNLLQITPPSSAREGFSFTTLATSVKQFTPVPGKRLVAVMSDPTYIAEYTTRGRVLRTIGSTSLFTYTDEAFFPSPPIAVSQNVEGYLVMLAEDGTIYRLQSGSRWEPYVQPPDVASYRNMRYVGARLVLWGDTTYAEYDEHTATWETFTLVDNIAAVTSGDAGVQYVVHPSGMLTGPRTWVTGLQDVRDAVYWKEAWWVSTARALYTCIEPMPMDQ